MHGVQKNRNKKNQSGDEGIIETSRELLLKVCLQHDTNERERKRERNERAKRRKTMIKLKARIMRDASCFLGENIRGREGNAMTWHEHHRR